MQPRRMWSMWPDTHHETVRVGGQDETIRGNVCRGLDVSKATKYKPESTIPSPSTAGCRISRNGRSSSSSETPFCLAQRPLDTRLINFHVANTPSHDVGCLAPTS
ncbi:hypothetical protein K458DRAFT_422143 [Lentithecium fluviatile CBS 122367]|uniref:Uncharacterized protein n=1 Tax=Lentithecium fluviatile CBS 122367 TaxID=1168545 RepID=A0A6G1IMX1_9PLEO|nr:hypothetical protein K458DRAFT_422143 [Lentithecium fluviatile CBS 122367]